MSVLQFYCLKKLKEIDPKSMNPAVQMFQSLPEKEESDDVVTEMPNKPKTQKAKFDPTKSQMDPATLANFIQSHLTSEITSVPGVKTANAEKIAHASKINIACVDTPWQLIGLFLMLKQKNMTKEEHCDAFAQFLQENGISQHRNTIVTAIAEKCNVYFPEIYTSSF